MTRAFARFRRGFAAPCLSLSLLLLGLVASCESDREERGSPAPHGAAPKPAPSAAPRDASKERPSAAVLDDKVFEGLPGRTVAGRILDATGRPAPEVVVYIKDAPVPAGEKAPQHEGAAAAGVAVIDQKNKTFLPRVVPVLAGTRVEFRNSDVVLHNAYSRSKAKAFDLGAFSSKETKSVVLDSSGRVDVFCAIHTNMHSILLVLDSPYFATTDAQGAFRIEKVPAGKRSLVVWHDVLGEQEITVDVVEERPTLVKHALRGE